MNPLRNRLEFCSLLLLGTLLAAGWGSGCRSQAESTDATWPQYTLSAVRQWPLNAPRGMRFDASGLLKLPDGRLLTISDRGPQLYFVSFDQPPSEATLTIFQNGFLSPPQPTARDGRPSYLDCEGLARDEQGRLYLCEESNRWILRCQPGSGTVSERLPIDWSPVSSFFSKHDPNASFEGVAVGRGRLYVANERSDPVILVVDLNTLQIKDHFTLYPKAWSFWGTHYSDLAWHEGHLYILCRQHRAILEVDPDKKKVLAEYDYTALEDRLNFQKSLPTGIMEGLAVDDDFFWLVTDNNGWTRGGEKPKDSRPVLLQCPRPAIGCSP